MIQPWCIAAWERFFKPGHIEVYETGTIEIGYNSFGPTIGLVGTLKATHRDLFIRRIRLTLFKDKDHSQHFFEWCLFRSHKMTLGTSGNAEEIAMERPYSFMVMHSQPHRYNILFFDQARLEELRSVLNPARADWYRHLQYPQHVSADLKSAYASFSSSQPHVSAYTSLDRLCYWEPGNYRLCMVIDTESGQLFKKCWSFSLSIEDEKNLRYNPIVIMQETCDQENIRYVFAYPRYQ